jgi:hypothetical protein
LGFTRFAALMKNTLLILFLAAFLGSCSTDFETNAPWKEITVVYGLLNPNDAVQYIRIGKAFLGEGNAYTMAQVDDSINYGDVLDVKIERFLNGNLMETHVLNRIDSIPKDLNGIFAAPHMVLYADINRFDTLVNESIYKLTVTNRETGNVVTASTKTIENFSIGLPTRTYTANLTGSVPTLTWKLKPSARGKIYGITQYINYLETDTTTHITVAKSVEWYIADKLTSGNSNTDVTFPFAKEDFYRLLGADCEVNPNVVRTLAANPLDVYISAGTEELYTYMQVTEQNSGIVQDKPLYSNIENGVGLFTSRNTQVRHVHLTADTYSALDSSVYTKDFFDK